MTLTVKSKVSDSDSLFSSDANRIVTDSSELGQA